MLSPETKYTRSGDVHIAYQVFGSGPIDLVYVPGWVSHVELCWEDPDYSTFLTGLSRFARVIMFDKRGTGMSDRVPTNKLPTLEERMDDLQVVMDAAGSQKAVLFGVSEGGNLCAYFAASHPERTTHLVLFGSFAKRVWSPDYPWAPTPEQREKEIRQVEETWGELRDLDHYAPSKAYDTEFAKRSSAYIRRAASPGAAVALLRMNTAIDITSILSAIEKPTLLLHRTGDRDAHIDEARWMATQITNAKFEELPGDDHFPWVGDSALIHRHIEAFATGGQLPEPITRVLSSILFTDIVRSTDRAHELGDAGWKQVLDRHDQMTQATIAKYSGRLIDNTGDGALATFDGPGRGIACGLEIIRNGRDLGIAIRSGMHTGECELRGDRVAGVAVHLASRVMGHANAGELLVSRTVRDLVAGSGFQFLDRGPHALKGFSDEWVLYEVSSPKA